MRNSPGQVPLPPFLLFHFPGPDEQASPLLFTAPQSVVTAERLEDVRPALAAVERATRGGLYAAGYLAYEASPAFDPALQVRPPGPMPLLWFGLFERPVSLELPACPSASTSLVWEPDTPRQHYDTAITAIRQAIERGETYQVNYTLRLRARFSDSADAGSNRIADLALYHRLRAAQGGGYSAYLHLGRYRVISASPELFFRREGETITTRPMKGTARRGRWPEEDERASARLLHSEKEQAENLMIVDLLRNDLGRIAQFGTVRVPHLFQVERYPTVHQMTSTITARLRDEIALEEIFAALFPCGSVTGAPKVTAMRAIAALETTPRGVYCGAVGFVAPGGNCTFNVAIRTVTVDGDTGEATYGVGGGVTWDSTAAGEYDELLAKAAVLHRDWPAFDLLETLRLDHGEYVRLDRHLQRLQESARYFGFRISLPEIAEALATHAREYSGAQRRVRLLVSRRGAVRVESTALPAAGPAGTTGPAAVQPVTLAGAPVSRDDPFLFHKTTRRVTYETHLAQQLSTRPGLFDVLLWNQEGEVTEFTRGNLVLELDGTRWTPPLACGLLAGTFRAELLGRGELRERILTLDDVRIATHAWLINSVREWVPVQLVP